MHEVGVEGEELSRSASAPPDLVTQGEQLAVVELTSVLRLLRRSHRVIDRHQCTVPSSVLLRSSVRASPASVVASWGPPSGCPSDVCGDSWGGPLGSPAVGCPSGAGPVAPCC